MSTYDKYRDLKGTAVLGLTTRSIDQTRTHRNSVVAVEIIIPYIKVLVI